MIEVFKYSNGKIKNVALKNINANKDYFWVDVSKAKKTEVKQVSEKLNLILDHVNASLGTTSLPRSEETKNYRFFLYRYSKDDSTSAIGIFTGKNFIVTLNSDRNRNIEKIKDTFFSNNKSEFFKKPSNLFYRILRELTKEYYQKIGDITEEVEKLENAAFDPNRNLNVRSLLGHKRTLLFYRRSLVKNKDISEDLADKKSKYDDQEIFNKYHHLNRELSEVISIIDLTLERIKGVMEISISRDANKLNDIMKGFTVIASLMLLPMLISGIWGMNFQNIPFYSLKYGFYIPIILMIALIITMFIFFRKKQWT